MIRGGDIAKGTVLIIKNSPYLVTDREFVSPGKGTAFCRCKMKNLKDGSVLSQTIKTPDTVEDAIVDTGYATQMVNFTYSITVENDSIFLKLVKKYNNRTDMWSNDEWSSLILFVLDVEKNELVHYEKYK